METWREHLQRYPTHSITVAVGQLTTCDHGDFTDPLALLSYPTTIARLSTCRICASSLDSDGDCTEECDHVRNDPDALGYRPDLPYPPSLPGDVNNAVSPGAWKKL